MINFQTIRQNIINTEYGFDKPKSLVVVLVPIVSLIFKKIQVSNLMSTLKATYTRPVQFSDLLDSREYTKIGTLHKWHAVGSLIQTISLLSLLTINPLFLIPAAFSMYELLNSVKGISSEEIKLDGQLHLKK